MARDAPAPTTEGRRLLRRVGATLFLLLIFIYWGIGLNFSFAYALRTEEQARHILLAYLWELPAIGVPLAVIIPLWLLRPVARDYDAMLRGERLPDPARSAARLLAYPRRIVWYFTPASIGAYFLGTMLTHVITRTPLDEFYKGVPLGFPLGLLFSLASYVVLVHYLEPVRRLFVLRHGYGALPSPRTSIYRKVVVTSITAVTLSLGLLWLIAYAQGQVILEDQLHARMAEGAVPTALAAAQGPDDGRLQERLHEAALGERGYVFLVDREGAVRTDHPRGARTLADEGWDDAARAAMLGGGPGRYTDRVDTVRLVAYAPVPGADAVLVVVTYRDDFAAPLGTMTAAMFAASLVGLAVAAVLTLTGARSITRPVRELTEAMRRARDDGTGGQASLMTDDEVGALARSYDTMMQRLREKTAALEDSVERMKEMDAVKTRFINIASHELRTPMTPIRTELHLMRTGKRGALTPEQAKGLDMVARNVDRLNRLIRDLLEASRMQAGHFRLQIRSVALADVVSTVVTTMHGEAQAKGVALEADLDVAGELQVRADEDRIGQVLMNLVENAIQFTPAGGQVRVAAAQEGDEVRIEVRDTGAGIEPHLIGRLFQPFSQAEPGVPRTEGGTGLGLFICKGIVGGHGGRIWCTSEGKGKGAVFHFTLPVAGPVAGAATVDPFGAPAAAPAAPSPGDAPEPARVL